MLFQALYLYRLAFENGRARNYPDFQLELAASENPAWLTIAATELAFHCRGLALIANEKCD
jgi:hypothetical protein